MVHLWEGIAERYRGNPWVAGYNPINEPADAEGSTIGPFYRRLEAAIRAVDPEHILFLDGNRYSTQSRSARRPAARTPSTPPTTTRCPASSTAARTRGVSRGEYVDRDRVEETFLARTAYMRETGTPIWVGEFGPVYTGDPARDEQRYRLLRDQLEIFAPPRRELGAVDVQGHRTAGRGAPRSRAPPTCGASRRSLAKKARLGVDSWGATDAARPLHRASRSSELFASEFPGLPALPVGCAPVDRRPRPSRDARRGDGRRLRLVLRRRGS